MNYHIRLFILILISMACIFESHTQQVCMYRGSGSTAAQPYYNRVIAQFNRLFPQSLFAYAGVGSGAGVTAFLAGQTQYAGTDNFLTDAQLAANPDILHFPTALLGVSLAYNLPGNPSIKLNANVLSKIYLGTITMWNDPALVALNPGVTLPSIPIVVVFRSDGSGTTDLFTTFLYISNIGYPQSLVGTLVPFPGGTIGVVGSPAVVAAVEANTGAIGYVSFDVVQELDPSLTVASIINTSGNAIAPSIDAFEAALVGVSIPTDLRILSLNTANPDGYPIANPTFIIVHSFQPNPLQAMNIRQFLYFIATQGQLIAPTVFLAPLPPAVLAQYRLNLLAIQSVVNTNAASCSALCPS